MTTGLLLERLAQSLLYAADEKADGIILACQAKSVGDLVVDA